MAQHPAPPGTTVYRVVDVDFLPAQVETRGSRFLGGFSVFLGVSLAVLPAIGLVVSLLKNGWSPDLKEATLWFSPLVVLGVWLLWWGINQWMQRLTIVIDGDQVVWQRRSIRGASEETEPLAAFEGLRGLDRWSSEDGDLYELSLQHRDPARTILLYRANRATGFADRWKQYCRTFRVSPLEYMAPDEPFARDVNDLGRPMWELVREGRLQVPDPGPAPDGVRVERGDDRVILHVGRGMVLSASARSVTGTKGRGLAQEYQADTVDAITVELARPPYRHPWLKLAYRSIYPSDSGVPSVLWRSACLAEGLPLPVLKWLQRFLLRTLAGC